MPHIQAVGIDLGTTYSAVARLDEAGRSAMVRNSQGDLLTPSVVLFDDDEIVVGRDAKKALATDPDRVADCAKRDMGQTHYSRLIRGRNLPPEVIQSCILRRLKEDAAAALGPDFKAVVTVPAYFDEPRRKATADAGEMAGLAVLDIVNEPTAAALAFGEQLGYLDSEGCLRQPMKVLVYDLGGGTFDVTLIDLAAGSFRTLATDGDVQLGGRDWDARLRDHAADEFVKRYRQDPRHDIATLGRLDRAVEEAKHTLSVRDRTDIHVECAGQAYDVPVTRELFEDLTADLLERTAYTTRQVLAGGHAEWRDVNHVLLVGGSTRMPMVARRLRELSGLDPVHGVNPDEAVARGAAIYAGYLLAKEDAARPGGRFRVVDVNSHSLGIEGVDAETLRKQNIILIPRNTPLPCSVQEKFTTKIAGQRSVVIQVLEGESKVPDQCSRVARAVLRDLPPGLAQGWPIEVSYEYRANACLAVTAIVPGTDRNLVIELEREAGLSGERLASWKHVLSVATGFDPFARLAAGLPNPIGLVAKGGPLLAPTRLPGSPVANPQISGLKALGSEGPARLPTTPKAGLSSGPQIKISAGTSDDAYDVQPDEPQAATNLSAKTLQGDTPQDDMQAWQTQPDSGADEPDAPADSEDVATYTVASRRQPKPNPMARTVVNLVAHLMSSILGLTLGYYILCWISPQSNFLHLNLPGLPAPPSTDPAQGPAPMQK